MVFERLLEIGYEAEVNTDENPELLELAEEACNEYQATRATAITDLRKMIFARQECNPIRTDDEFLLRFLRARKFVIPRAHKLLVRYCNFREQNKNLYEGVDLWGLEKADKIYEGTMVDHPDTGRLTIIKFGEWEPSELSAEDVMRVAVAMMEIGTRQPKLQILGGTVVIDMAGISLKHMATFTPTIAYQIVCIMGLAIPAHIKAIHIINYSWTFNTFFYIFKKVIPQHAWDRLHFHRSDYKSLHKHIKLECLPPKYGGTCRKGANVGLWLKKIRKYRDEKFDREMKELGYVIKE